MQRLVKSGLRLLTLRQINKQSLISVAHRKSFSTESKSEDKLRKLKRSLDGEISFEESQLIDYSNIFGYFQKQGWSVSDLPKNPLVVLSKIVDKKIKAVLALRAQSPSLESQKMGSMVDRLRQIEAAQKQLELSEEDAIQNTKKDMAMDMIDTMNQFVLMCPLYINFGGEQSIKLFLAFSEENITITSCCTTSEDFNRSLDDFSESNEPANQIEYDELNEDVQQSIADFIESLGVDKEFSIRCQQLAMAKDQRLYYDFLKRFSELIDLK